jgi:hypothetical protein
MLFAAYYRLDGLELLNWIAAGPGFGQYQPFDVHTQIVDNRSRYSVSRRGQVVHALNV